MEDSKRLKSLLELKHRSFELNRVRYDVTDVRFYMNNYTVYSPQRTFVKSESQFETFLREIKILPIDEPLKKVFIPYQEQKTLKTEMIMDIQTTTEVATATNEAATVNTALLTMFNKLSDKPTEADYKQAEAMSKLANTIISAKQMQINFFKLKQGK